MPALRTNTKVH